MAADTGSTIALAHGPAMPRMGLGTWPMRGADAEAGVATAIANGFRLIDTAYSYGNEEAIGRAIRRSGVDRSELFITSKLNGEWHGFAEARQAYADSLGRLGLAHLDLFLVHWPLPGRDRYVDAWRGLVSLLEEGSVRAIGTSNFKAAHLARVIDATEVAPDVNQVELNPYVTRSAVRAFDEAHGIARESWSPLGRGGALLAEPVVAAIAGRVGRTPAQVVLAWHLALGLVVIPKSSSPERQRENLAAFDVTLDAADLAAISALDRGEAAAVDSDSFGH